jgi:hypothetical protein
MKKTKLLIAMTAALGFQASVIAEPTWELGGVIEVEATSGEDTSDIAVATAELGIGAEINEKVSGEVVLLHEAGEPDPIVVDVATVSLAFSDTFSVTAGQSYAPFGVFDSNMISDPLTLEMAETAVSSIQADIASGALTTSLYTFNGTNEDEEIDNWGASIGYEAESFSVALGYIANIGDSDGIAAETIDSEVPGMSVSASAGFGAFSLIGEYIAASDDFKAGDGSFTAEAQPSASNVELAYTAGATTFAVGQQNTDEAEELGLPETRTLAAISHEFMENTTLALEYASDEDYAGEESSMVTAQIAVEF